MGAFLQSLRPHLKKRPGNRRWLYVAYDQLSQSIGPLATEDPRELGIVLIESADKASRRPYHRQKLALVLANMRHFALEQALRGVAVHYEFTDQDYGTALRRIVAETGPLQVLRPAERELRFELGPLFREGLLKELPHDGWLTLPADFQALGEAPWRMDAFYRKVRQRTGILMEGQKPVGGQYSFDAENRRPWKGAPPAPTPPGFKPDEITTEVCELIEQRYSSHPGVLNPETLPAAAADVERLWAWAQQSCLPHFGPYEDAMSTRSTGLFHTRISPLLNLQRLSASRVVNEVLELPIPIASKEGFVRQILGWREFVRHVHEATDGMRTLSGQPLENNALQADLTLPPVFWGGKSGLACLDQVLEDVWSEGYSHHITRLMVIGNIATLLGIEPRQLSDWFRVAYTDAYDWVVEPNVLAMATYGTGALMTTKPYVAGSAYIDRMSDYCKGCVFDPKRSCPLTAMYWDFLGRNSKNLQGNQRIAMPLRAQARRSAQQKRRDALITKQVRASLEQGKALGDHLGFEA
jgi:deoxyribodipyrimidine photolyase-related protein